MILENNLVWANLVYRDYNTEFTGKKVGDTVTIRGPASFTANEFTAGGNVTVQDITEASVDLVVEKHYDITVAIGAKERTLDLESFSYQVLRPQMVAMAQAIDSYIATKTIEVFSGVGTPTDPPDTLAELAALNKKLHENKCPAEGRVCVVDPACEADLLSQPFFTTGSTRGAEGETALKNASMGRVMGLDWYMNQNVPLQTKGTLAGSPVTSADVATGATTIPLTGATEDTTILQGDIVTIAGGTNATQQYVATADVTLTTASGVGDLLVSPPVQGTVGDADAIPSGGAVTIVASHRRNCAFTRNAFALAVVPLELPAGAASAEYVQSRGMGLRLVSDYSATTKVDTMSLDVLVGAKCIDPWQACRLYG
jgi:hypothetical protein